MNKQRGFTLVEIAIALVAIGLLLGGILRAQELLGSARVNNIAKSVTNIQSAYYAFHDRYGKVPGDWNPHDASLATGVTIVDGGNDNGRIDNGTTAPADWTEPNAAWVQLVAAGFLDGSFAGGSTAPSIDNDVAPLNAYHNVMTLGWTPDSIDNQSSVSRLQLVIGRGIPVDVMRQLDLKIDDGFPFTGQLRATVESNAVFGYIAEQDPACVDALHLRPVWNAHLESSDCNAVYSF